jgi:hypothetical protein
MSCRIVAKVSLTMGVITNIYVEKDEVNEVRTQDVPDMIRRIRNAMPLIEYRI